MPRRAITKRRTVDRAYSEFEGTRLWVIVEKALIALQGNNDIVLTTDLRHVTGYICQQIGTNPTAKTLRSEALRATKLLSGKVIHKVWRHSEKQMGIQFADGTRLFVDHSLNGVELSIT
jgi:hypothetical protein